MKLYNSKVQDYYKDELILLPFKDFYKNRSKFISSLNRTLYNQIIFMESGSGKFWVDINKFQANGTNIFTYVEGQVQIIENANDITGYVLLFTQQFLFKNSDKKETLEENIEILEKLMLTTLFKPSPTKFNVLLDVIYELHSELSKDRNKIQESIIYALFKILLLKTHQITTELKTIKCRENSDYKLLLQFRKLLEKNYNLEKTISFYSAQLFITSKKLNEIIKKYFGKSVKHIIEERILLEAKRYLIHSDLTAKEISNLVGFNDPINFSKGIQIKPPLNIEKVLLHNISTIFKQILTI